MPSYGPEMRGGTANVTVILSDTRISSPIVQEYDTVIALNQQSLDKFEPRVKKGGTLIYDPNGISTPPSRTDISIYKIAAADEAAKMNNSKTFNMIVLGGLLKVKPIVELSNVEKGLLTRSEAQKLQEELGQEQARLLQLQESKRQQLLEEEQVRLRKVTAAIQGFINRYNQSHGYNYILSVGTLYADPRLSITAEVLKGLNEEYAAEHAKNAKK